MADEKVGAVQEEARELIAFYDARGWDWTNALTFTLCRDLFGSGICFYNPETHFAMQKRTVHNVQKSLYLER